MKHYYIERLTFYSVVIRLNLQLYCRIKTMRYDFNTIEKKMAGLLGQSSDLQG
jgi:hypothetical protein